MCVRLEVNFFIYGSIFLRLFLHYLIT